MSSLLAARSDAWGRVVREEVEGRVRSGGGSSVWKLWVCWEMHTSAVSTLIANVPKSFMLNQFKPAYLS